MSRQFGLKPRTPADEATTGIAVTMAAELVVVIGIFLFAAITVNGYSIWSYVVGIAE